jgi:hypothetical protein
MPKSALVVFRSTFATYVVLMFKDLDKISRHSAFHCWNCVHQRIRFNLRSSFDCPADSCLEHRKYTVSKRFSTRLSVPYELYNVSPWTTELRTKFIHHWWSWEWQNDDTIRKVRIRFLLVNIMLKCAQRFKWGCESNWIKEVMQL